MNTLQDKVMLDLASALDDCAKSPLVPGSFEELGKLAGNAKELRHTVDAIKADLPMFLLKTPRPAIIQLTRRLRSCEDFAKRVAARQQDIDDLLKIMTDYDKEVLDLHAHADEMAAVAEFGWPLEVA